MALAPAPAASACAAALLPRRRAVAVVAAAFARCGQRRVELHRQRDALARQVDLEHAHLDHGAGLDHFARVVHELVAHLADVHQAVLVHAEVDEGAELRHVADRAFQHHAGLQVLQVGDAVVEARHLEVGARVAAGLLQLGEDVLDGDGAEALVGEGLGPQRAQHLGAAHQFGHRPAGGGQQLLHHRVGLGVHAGHVQRVVAVADAQEARRLLEGLGAQARHVEQLPAAAEGAMRIAPAHDARRHRRATGPTRATAAAPTRCSGPRRPR